MLVGQKGQAAVRFPLTLPSPSRGKDKEGAKTGMMRMSGQTTITGIHAKRLRRDQTDAERKLLLHLRSRQMNGFKFRRQQPIGRYIVDFFCSESKLVVELDGGQHADQVEADMRRTEFLTKAGYRVLRFWDNEVLTDTEAVLQKIVNELNHPSPSPLPQGARVKKPASSAQPSPSKGEGGKKKLLPLTLTLSFQGRGDQKGARGAKRATA